MIARAPGKLVLSGAYVVLDGAPAIVVAVDRYAFADTGRPPTFLGPELLAAFGTRTPPFTDSSELRAGGRKLGIGSSAAVLVAAIAADAWTERPETGVEEIARRAFDAHRRAQGGGSGIDVIASALGGVCECRARRGLPEHTLRRLPAGLTIETWACAQSARTSALLRPVRRMATERRKEYAALTRDARTGAEAFADGIASGEVSRVLSGARAQRDAMITLGDAVGVSIVTEAMRAVSVFEGEGVFAQSGAGGGDVALFFGPSPSSPALRAKAEEQGMSLLPLALGARGVHLETPLDLPRPPAREEAR